MNYLWIFAVLFILVPLAIAGVSMAPWVPTKRKDIKRVVGILDMPHDGNFLEIGCGDARVSLAVAKRFPKAEIHGIELALPMYIVARIRKYIEKQKNVSLTFGNAFKQDFSHYDGIYVFGMPDKITTKIVPKFMSEAKKGAKLYSYVFSIPDKYKKNASSVGGAGESKIHILEKK